VNVWKNGVEAHRTQHPNYFRDTATTVTSLIPGV
jgi:hypothetical protein